MNPLGREDNVIGLALLVATLVTPSDLEFDLQCEFRARSGQIKTQALGIDLNGRQWCIRPACSIKEIFEATDAIVVLDRRQGNNGSRFERIIDLERMTMRDVFERDPLMPSYITAWNCTSAPFSGFPTTGF